MLQVCGSLQHGNSTREPVDRSEGVKLTIVFTCASPAMELRSVWQAYEGPGPVHHSMFIANKS